MSTASWSTDGDQFQFPSPSPGYNEKSALMSNVDVDFHVEMHVLSDLATSSKALLTDSGGDAMDVESVAAATHRFCPYSMRSRTLQNLPPPTRLTKGTVLAQKKAVEKQQRHIKRGPPCLDILRKTLQILFNVDVKRLLDKYRDEMIEPALRNMRENDESVRVDDDYPNMLIRQLLDDAKRMYAVNGSATTPFSANSLKQNGARRCQHASVKPIELISNHPPLNSCGSSVALRQTVNSGGCGREFDHKQPVESASVTTPPANAATGNSKIRRLCPIDIDSSTEFVTGSMANAALGYSHARGRIYSKHPEVFRYMPDAEDKQWLLKNDIIKSLVGKVFLLRLCDVRKLVQSAEYRTQAGVSIRPLRPFTLSDFMLNKLNESSNNFSNVTVGAVTNGSGESVHATSSKNSRMQSSSRGNSSVAEKSKLTGVLPLSPASAGGSSRRSDSDALGEDFVVRKTPALRRQTNAVSEESIDSTGDANLFINDLPSLADGNAVISGADDIVTSDAHGVSEMGDANKQDDVSFFRAYLLNS